MSFRAIHWYCKLTIEVLYFVKVMERAVFPDFLKKQCLVWKKLDCFGWG